MSNSADESPIDVLGLGSVAFDDLLYVDEYPAPDRKTRVQQKAERVGGLTGGALMTAARLGARCAYAGRLGLDAASRLVDEAFIREGIETRWASRDASHGVGRGTIIVSLKHGTRNVFSQHTGKTGADDLQPAEAVIRRARVLFVDHHGVDGSIRAARIARECGNAVVADFERNDPPRFSELLDLVDHLILPEDFACRLTGTDFAKEAVAELRTPGREVVIVTAGDRGCWFAGSNHGSVQHMPALKVDAVDTTGCGDTFHGAYAAALAQGAALEARLRFATAAAAFKAAAPIGSDGLPRREDLDLEALFG